MKLPPPTSTVGARRLHLHDDPSKVGAWCRERVSDGCVYVAPSAAARRQLQRSLVVGGRVTVGVAITTPTRLLPLLEARAGIATPRTLSSTLERLLVAEAAREARVPLFDDEGDAPGGAVDAVARLISQLLRNGVSPDDYRAAGGDARVAAAYAGFAKRRASLGFADEAERVAALVALGVPSLALVMEDPALPHATALALHRALVASSVSCHVGVSDLAGDGARSPLVDRLASLGLELTMERGAPSRPDVSAIGGAGTYDEIELVARRILALLRSGAAVVPRDILAVAPTRHYLSLLHDALARVGVPVASPRRVPVLDVPIVRALVGMFRLLADPDEDTPERGLELLATPYVGLSLGRHDRLARRLVRVGEGSARSWRRVAGDETPGPFRRLAESVETLAAALAGPRAPYEHAALLSKVALDYGFLSSGRRANLAAGRDDAVRLDQQGWNEVANAVEELDESLRFADVRRLGAREWIAELERTLADTDVRADAKARDGVHLARAGAGLPCVSHVFALGWREGLVPRRVREDPLLPDRVKRALNAHGALFALSADRAGREREHRERVVRAARQSLVISWPATGDEGEPMLPSFYLDDLGVERREVRSVGDVTWPVALAASRAERVTRATMLAKHRPAASLGAELGAVRDTLAAVTAAERRAYDTQLHAARTVSLHARARAELAPLAREMSATQARMLAHCAYEHFGKRRLGLEPLAPPALDALSLGGIAHRILARVGRAGWDRADVDALLAAEWKRAVSGALSDDPTEAFQREILREQLHALVAAERELLAASAGRPTYFELAFGMADDDRGEERDPASIAEGVELPLPAGSAIPATTLRGSIDRVDVIERDGRRYGVAIDYKSGKGESNYTDEMELADFQLSIYCEALPKFGVEPVGALYLGVSSGERYGVVRSDFAEAFGAERFAKATKLSPDEFAGFIAERRGALVEHVAALAAGRIEIRPRKDDCKYCDLRPVCRIGTFGVGARGAGDE